jgi:hypothetical protein
MSAKLGLVIFVIFCCSTAVAQEQSANYPCTDKEVTTAIAKYFAKPAALASTEENRLLPYSGPSAGNSSLALRSHLGVATESTNFSFGGTLASNRRKSYRNDPGAAVTAAH